MMGMNPEWQTIALHPHAPAKPAVGAPCNGCGVCCAAEPCPVARLFLWQRRGACRALVWEESAGCYRCGMLADPAQYSWLIPVAFNGLAQTFFAKRIAAGAGCDSSAEVETASRP